MNENEVAKLASLLDTPKWRTISMISVVYTFFAAMYVTYSKNTANVSTLYFFVPYLFCWSV